jgi:hypothetical protein
MKKLGLNVLAIAATFCAGVATPEAALASATCQATINISTSSTGMSCSTSQSESTTGTASFLAGNQVKVQATYVNGQVGARGFLLNGAGNTVCLTDVISTIGQTKQFTCSNNGVTFFRLSVD